MCAEALAAFAKHHYKEHKNEKNPQFKCFHQQLTKAGLECMHFLKYYRKCWSWLLFKFTNTTSVFDSALQLKLAGSFWLDFPECFLAMSKNNVLFLSLLQHASSINYNFSIFWSSCLSYAVNFWMFSLVLSLVCLSHTVDGIKLSNTHLIWFTYI